MSHPRFAPWLVILCTAAFGAALATRELINPWLSNASAAVFTLVVSSWALGRRRRELLAFRPAGALVAALLGALLVVATHVGYSIATAVFPALEPSVAEHYREIESRPPGPTTALVIACVVAAEELLWRGVAVELLERVFSPLGVLAVAVPLYAIPQMVGGSWLLLAAALVLGAIFTAQRLYTGRLTEPLITHAIWSVSVFYAVPLV